MTKSSSTVRNVEPCGDQCVADDLAGVELRSEKVAAHFTGKHRALVTDEPAQRHGGIKRDRRKERSGDWVARASVGKVRIESAINQVHERVSQSALRLLKPIVGADDVATRGKRDFDEIDEPAAEHFGFGAVGPAADECTAVA